MTRETVLHSRSGLAPMHEIELICRESHVVDLFLLYQLGKNMDPMTFRDFITDLRTRLESIRIVERGA